MGCTGSSISQDCDDATPAELPFHSQYKLRGKIGRGAFAQVHLAIKVVDPKAEEVAVKVTDLRAQADSKEPIADRLAANKKRARAAKQEANILRRVGPSPHVVWILAEFQQECFSYIVMEKCDRTLLQVLDGLPDINEHGLLMLFTGMMKGIAHVHTLSVVHRDIKPDNFLCCGPRQAVTNTVKLCDFGLASLNRSNESNLRGVYGTVPFMSPEMLGSVGYGAPTDVWSFGVLAYVLLLGRFPYHPADGGTQAMKAAILAGQPVPTFKSGLCPDGAGKGMVSKTAVLFLQALLCRDPIGRPTAKEVMRHSWMHSAAEADEPSLRPMLYSAKRAGAFDTRGLPESKEQDKDSIDAMLAALHAKHHSPDPGIADLPLACRKVTRTTTESTTEPAATPSNFTSLSVSIRSGVA